MDYCILSVPKAEHELNTTNYLRWTSTLILKQPLIMRDLVLGVTLPVESGSKDPRCGQLARHHIRQPLYGTRKYISDWLIAGALQTEVHPCR